MDKDLDRYISKKDAFDDNSKLSMASEIKKLRAELEKARQGSSIIEHAKGKAAQVPEIVIEIKQPLVVQRDVKNEKRRRLRDQVRRANQVKKDNFIMMHERKKAKKKAKKKKEKAKKIKAKKAKKKAEKAKKQREEAELKKRNDELDRLRHAKIDCSKRYFKRSPKVYQNPDLCFKGCSLPIRRCVDTVIDYSTYIRGKIFPDTCGDNNFSFYTKMNGTFDMRFLMINPLSCIRQWARDKYRLYGPMTPDQIRDDIESVFRVFEIGLSNLGHHSLKKLYQPDYAIQALYRNKRMAAVGNRKDGFLRDRKNTLPENMIDNTFMRMLLPQLNKRFSNICKWATPQRDSKVKINEIIKIPINIFSYPFSFSASREKIKNMPRETTYKKIFGKMALVEESDYELEARIGKELARFDNDWRAPYYGKITEGEEPIRFYFDTPEMRIHLLNELNVIKYFEADIRDIYSKTTMKGYLFEGGKYPSIVKDIEQYVKEEYDEKKYFTEDGYSEENFLKNHITRDDFVRAVEEKAMDKLISMLKYAYRTWSNEKGKSFQAFYDNAGSLKDDFEKITKRQLVKKDIIN